MPAAAPTSEAAHVPEAASADEIARFSALAPRWWDPHGPMRPLHEMNALRTSWVDARLAARPARLLDVGCGGGLAAEALTRAGHDVLGIDASHEAIAVAVGHARAQGLLTDYRACLASDLAGHQTFDAVVALEVIEHVPDQPGFVAILADLLRPGGMLFVSTLNRSLRSLAVAKIGAEYIARLLPVGTHDWRRFVKPEELAGMGRGAGLRLGDIAGLTYSPSRRLWRSSADLGVNYIAAFTRG